MHDFVLVYQKSTEWQRKLLPRTEENNKQYRFEDEGGLFRASDYTCNKTAEERPTLYYPVINPKTGEEVWPKKSRVWAYSPEMHEENVKRGLVFWGEDGNAKTPSYKRYLNALKGGGGIVPVTWWTHEFAGHNDEAAKETNELIDRVFTTPKPIRLIQQILRISTEVNDNDIILDFFSGSATTAHAVMQLNAEDGGNRRFIMVQLPEVCEEKSEAYKAGYQNICEIGKERIRRAGAKIRGSLGQSAALDLAITLFPIDNEEEVLQDVDGKLDIASSLDTGFRVFKLDTSNLKTWDNTPVADDDLISLTNRLNAMTERVKSDRTDLDMVYEVMLKLGVPITESIAVVDFDGVTAYSVREDCLLLICLQDDITTEMVEKMADYAPARMIFGQTCFADITSMSNAKLVLKDRGIEMKMV